MKKKGNTKEEEIFIEEFLELCKKHAILAIVLEMEEGKVDLKKLEITFQSAPGMMRPRFTQVQERWIEKMIRNWYWTYKGQFGAEELKEPLRRLEYFIKGEKMRSSTE